jgi:hypothetical protein
MVEGIGGLRIEEVSNQSILLAILLRQPACVTGQPA